MNNIEFTPQSIEEYILEELKGNKDFLFNELDLQMFVARALEKKFSKNYKIHLEYHLPKGWNEKFDNDYLRWGTEKPYFDIVLENPEELKFIAIELKYKLKEVKLKQVKHKQEIEFNRFGLSPQNEDIKLVTNQSAENEGRYDFWKDVKRLELLKEHFSGNVIGGIALFVTNQQSYTKGNSDNKYTKFNFEEKKSVFLHWTYIVCEKGFQCGNHDCRSIPCGEKLKKNKKKIKYWGSEWIHYTRPNFELKGEYVGKWYPNKEGFEGPMKELFYCYSVII